MSGGIKEVDNTKLSELIGQRINGLLAANEVKQKDLAQYLGIRDNIVSYFCSGTRVPNTEQIKRIAEYFKVSADYLLGISDTPSTDKDIKGVSDYTGLNERFINLFLKDELLSKRYFLDFINSIGESDTLSDDFDSMLFYLNDYITAVKKIQTIQKETEEEPFETFLLDGIAADISAAIDERDIAKYRVEDKFKKIIQEYSGDNQISHIRDFFT